MGRRTQSVKTKPSARQALADARRAQPGLSAKQQLLWGAAALVLLVLFFYAPVLQNGFIWDDDDYVTNNLALRSWQGLVQIWTKPGVVPQYYPLVHTTYWLEYHLWQLQPAGYHLVNMLLHAVNALLLWWVLRRLRVPGAWLAAALFAVHPVHVESVAWVTERKNVLSGALYLLSLLAYLRFSRLDSSEEKAASPVAPRPWKFYALSLFLFGCALLSKSVTCSLPAVVLLLLWWKRGRIAWRDAAALVPFFLLGMASGRLTVWMEKHTVGAMGADWSLSFVERTLIAGRALWFYVYKLLLPLNLSFVYTRWKTDTSAGWQYLFPAAAALVVAALFAFRSRLGRAPLVAALFFCGTLFPALGFIDLYPMQYTFVADHYQYLASLGVLVPLGALLALGYRHMKEESRTPARVGAGALVAGLGILCWMQEPAYKDLETLWLDTLKKNPESSIAHNNLGNILMRNGQLEQAADEYAQALRFRPNYPLALFNLGRTCQKLGRMDDAVTYLRRGLELKADDDDARLYLADALTAAGKASEALPHYKELLRKTPDNCGVLVNQGNALGACGQLEQARQSYEAALKVNPDLDQAHANLAITFSRLKRFDEARQHYEQAVRIAPDNPATRYNFAYMLEQLGKTQEAVVQYKEALRLRPDWPQAQQRLAALTSSASQTN